MAIGLAAIGEAASERSGVFNIGIEGIMLSAAFVAAWGSVRTGSPWLGIIFAAMIGLLLAGVHAVMVLIVRIDQFVSGIGMVIFGYGFSSFVARLTIGAKPTSVPGLAALDLGSISHIPFIGPTLFAQSPLAYLAFALAIATGWVLKRTALGLEIRACGENADVAETLAIPVKRRQATCILFGGIMAGTRGGVSLGRSSQRLCGKHGRGARFFSRCVCHAGTQKSRGSAVGGTRFRPGRGDANSVADPLSRLAVSVPRHPALPGSHCGARCRSCSPRRANSVTKV